MYSFKLTHQCRLAGNAVRTTKPHTTSATDTLKTAGVLTGRNVIWF